MAISKAIRVKYVQAMGTDKTVNTEETSWLAFASSQNFNESYQYRMTYFDENQEVVSVPLSLSRETTFPESDSILIAVTGTKVQNGSDRNVLLRTLKSIKTDDGEAFKNHFEADGKAYSNKKTDVLEKLLIDYNQMLEDNTPFVLPADSVQSIGFSDSDPLVSQSEIRVEATPSQVPYPVSQFAQYLFGALPQSNDNVSVNARLDALEREVRMLKLIVNS